MGKRSDFERVNKDFYPTPLPALLPLLPHLSSSVRFCEPCVGDGHLARHLESFGHQCVASSDIERDVRLLTESDINNADYIITNPPWERKILHPAIIRCCSIRPTWFLFDADWMHTHQAADYLDLCAAIVSVGRVKWIENSPHTGKDNCCWYLFDANHKAEPKFYRRKKDPAHGRVSRWSGSERTGRYALEHSRRINEC